MKKKIDDICAQPDRLQDPPPTTPFSPAIYPASVWSCATTAEAEQVLSGERPGFVYRREGHPNAAMFQEKCAELHGAERAIATSSGMSALAAALLSYARQGDHLVVSRQLYGRSLLLLTSEAERMGITYTLVDTSDLDETAAALRANTRMLIVETISNPTLRVAPLPQLAELAHAKGGLLLVDNTFATPLFCRPLEHGADLVMESVSKMMNGHSDVMLGLLCGGGESWERVVGVVSTWGLTSHPLDCWLAARGLSTMHLRVDRANRNALAAARFLSARDDVVRVDFPQLESHPDHALANQLLPRGAGVVVTFQLPGGREAADRFIAAVSDRIPFCPSLGEVSTTLSHPQSTSHRGLSEQERQELGIQGGTIRLSFGVEDADTLVGHLAHGLDFLIGDPDGDLDLPDGSSQ